MANKVTNTVRNFYIDWSHRQYPTRIDHSRMYIWVHIGLALVGTSIVLRPRQVGVPTLSPDSNRILGSLIVWGSGLCLIACCMGIGKFFKDANVDLRIPYGCGAFGQLSVLVSLLYYLSIIVFHGHLSVVQLMSLGLSLSIACALVHIDTVILKEVWRIQHYKNNPQCEHWPELK